MKPSAPSIKIFRVGLTAPRQIACVHYIMPVFLPALRRLRDDRFILRHASPEHVEG